MALLRCQVYSDALEQGVSLTVVLPQPVATQIGVEGAGSAAPDASPDDLPPVLYLLHGLSDDDSAWTRFTAIERYAAAAGLAVVMPQVHRSFYTDIPRDGGAYWSFLSEELPSLVHRLFKVSDRREDTFVAGLSMGGFGAFKWALAQPERFAAAASLSGAVDLDWLIGLGSRGPLFDSVLAGRSVAEAGGDLRGALGAVPLGSSGSSDRVPRLYLACGTEDVLFEANQRFAAHAESVGFPLTVHFSPGEHEWGYWDARIAEVIAWLGLAT